MCHSGHREFYDGTYKYLKSLGLVEIKEYKKGLRI